MARFHPQTATTNVMAQRACPKCSATMMLARIEPEQPGYDLRTFECRSCGQTESVIEKI
jgi:DNA-directed RNA polymerase subunit M/transcription elongation factor TFIIS